MMSQRIQSLVVCFTACLCCLVLAVTTTASDRDTEKALKAKTKSIQLKNSAAVSHESAAKKQSGTSISKKPQIVKENGSLSRAFVRPNKAAYSGHHNIPDPEVFRQGGDNIASAFTIPSLPFAETGTTDGYNDDYDEICPYDAPESPDVVYKFTPVSSTSIDIDLCPSEYDTKLYVYENSVGNLVDCNDDADACALQYRSQLLNVPVSAGQTYYIVVDGYGGDFGTYDISVTEHITCIVDCPVNHVDEGEPCGDEVNDGCNMATPAYGEVKCGDTICGTAWADGDLRDTDWFLKTLTGDTTVSWCGTASFNFHMIIARIDGCGDEDITVIENETALPCDTLCESALLGPGTYVFFIAPDAFEGYACANGPWNYSVWLDCAEPPAAPANNTCANATPIGNVTDYPFTTVGATIDGPVTCTSFGFSQIEGDIWFCYTAPCTGVATASLCGSEFDTKMAVYDGCSCPAAAEDQIACNDDNCGLQSEAIFPVTGGHTYLIRVGGYQDEHGDGVLSVSCGSAAENDECSDVVPQSLPLVYSSDNTGATNGCDSLDGAEVWTAFTITECTDVVISYCGTSPAFETVDAVLVEGCPCGSFILYDDGNFDECGDGNATIYFHNVAPGTYYVPILSSAADGAEGPFTISITGTPCPPGYCEASSFVCDEYISRVAVGSIDNSSDCDNYADYTSLSTSMDIGTGYPITVENGFGYSSDQCGIWVDWNQDDFFEASEKVTPISGSPGYGPYTATITPPGSALNGPTRMRIRITYTGAVSPCGITDYGEVEDYTINVSGGPVTSDYLIVDPDSIYAAFMNFIDPMNVVLHLGNEFAPGYTVNDIDLSSVQLNGASPDSVVILPSYPGFSGPVLQIKQYIGWFIYPTYAYATGLTTKTATVSGSMTDATPFSIVSETFYYGGHPVGDVTKDARVNIRDVTYFVAFLFNHGPAPFNMVLADLNHNGNVTISDLTYLIRYLFVGGPAPIPADAH